MGGGYEQASLISRSRVNNDGSTFCWHYTDTPTGTYHRSANITYTNYRGMHTGSGTENYTEFGILEKQVLHNTDTWDETLIFENDGQYITTSTGIREDGVTVTYSHTGVGEIASHSDDKGITTWDPTQGKMLSTEGEFGTFTYTYSGAAVARITGKVKAGGSVVMDRYWNVEKWTDSKGVVHNYTASTKNKAYVTSATETFTDKNGAVWSGTVQYKDTGFYFKSATLEATNAKVDQSTAANTVEMDKNAAYDFIKQLIAQYDNERETFTWRPDGDSRTTMTLGECKVEGFDISDITGYADVKVTINGDGSSTSIFKNIKFIEDQFVKKNRYKPTYTTRTYTVIQNSQPSTGDYRDMNKYNDVFYKGSIGKRTRITGSKTVQTGTKTETYYVEIIPDNPETDENEYKEIEHSSQTYDKYGEPLYEKRRRQVAVYSTKWTIEEENWTKTADGWQWVATGFTEENSYADSLELDTGIVTAGPIGQEGMATASAVNLRKYQTSWGNKAGGVSLAGGMAASEDKDGGKGYFRSPVDKSVQAASASDIAQEPATTETKGGKGRTSMSTEEVDNTEVTAEATPVDSPGETPTKDEVVAAFQNIKDLDDVNEFLKLLASKMDNQAVLAALKNSTAVNLMNSLVQVYKVIFGEAYQSSLLSKLIAVVTDNTVIVEELKTAITGGTVVASEVKLAAKIAADMQNAQSVKKDEKGNVIEVVDANGNRHKYQYEAKGFTERVEAGRT